MGHWSLVMAHTGTDVDKFHFRIDNTRNLIIAALALSASNIDDPSRPEVYDL